VKQDASDVDDENSHDEWVSTGITYAMKAEETDEKAIFWLEKAMDCLSSRNPSLQDKIEAHRSCVHFRKNSKSTASKVVDSSVVYGGLLGPV
jgi:hypothetical protein